MTTREYITVMSYFVITKTGRCTAPISYATQDEAEDARRAFEQILGVPCTVNHIHETKSKEINDV